MNVLKETRKVANEINKSDGDLAKYEHKGLKKLVDKLFDNIDESGLN